MSTHPTPLAAAALYGQVATLAAPDLVVSFGPTGEFSEPKLIAVGLATQTANPLSGEITGAGMASSRYGFTVDCLAQCWSGDADLTDRMVQAFDLVDQVRAVLPAVVEAVDGVWSADVVRESFTPLVADQGGIALVEFAVAFAATRLS